MPLDVRLHLLLVLKRLFADGALVALRAIVLHTVQLKHVVVSKISEANVAVVGLLTRMRS